MQMFLGMLDVMGLNGILFTIFALGFISFLLRAVFSKPIRVETTYVTRPQFYDQHKKSHVFVTMPDSKGHMS